MHISRCIIYIKSLSYILQKFYTVFCSQLYISTKLDINGNIVASEKRKRRPIYCTRFFVALIVVAPTVSYSFRSCYVSKSSDILLPLTPSCLGCRINEWTTAILFQKPCRSKFCSAEICLPCHPSSPGYGELGLKLAERSLIIWSMFL